VCLILLSISTYCSGIRSKFVILIYYRGSDKSLARPGRKQAPKHVRDVRDFNKIETRAFIKFLLLEGKAPKEIHTILTETLACFLPGRARDLSAPLYITQYSFDSMVSSSGVWAYVQMQHIKFICKREVT